MLLHHDNLLKYKDILSELISIHLARFNIHIAKLPFLVGWHPSKSLPCQLKFIGKKNKMKTLKTKRIASLIALLLMLTTAFHFSPRRPTLTAHLGPIFPHTATSPFLKPSVSVNRDYHFLGRLDPANSLRKLWRQMDFLLGHYLAKRN